LDKNYNKFELANKILKPSYISLQSALGFHGINFQYEDTIFVIANKTYDTIIDNNKICFRFFKKDLRENLDGIENLN